MLKKPFQCELCDKSYSSYRELKYHLHVHTGERPYKCVNCSKTFTQSYGLNNHVRRHCKHKTNTISNAWNVVLLWFPNKIIVQLQLMLERLRTQIINGLFKYGLFNYQFHNKRTIEDKDDLPYTHTHLPSYLGVPMSLHIHI